MPVVSDLFVVRVSGNLSPILHLDELVHSGKIG